MLEGCSLLLLTKLSARLGKTQSRKNSRAFLSFSTRCLCSLTFVSLSKIACASSRLGPRSICLNSLSSRRVRRAICASSPFKTSRCSETSCFLTWSMIGRSCRVAWWKCRGETVVVGMEICRCCGNNSFVLSENNTGGVI